MKARVFIGSSVEGDEVANAIQESLDQYQYAEVSVWNQGIFDLSRGTIETLTQTLNNVDFSVFVFSPDVLLLYPDIKKTSTCLRIYWELLQQHTLKTGQIGTCKRH